MFGDLDLEEVLKEVEILFSRMFRLNVIKIFVVLLDVVVCGNDNVLIVFVVRLRKSGVFILLVGFGGKVD